MKLPSTMQWYYYKSSVVEDKSQPGFYAAHISFSRAREDVAIFTISI